MHRRLHCKVARRRLAVLLASVAGRPEAITLALALALAHALLALLATPLALFASPHLRVLRVAIDLLLLRRRLCCQRARSAAPRPPRDPVRVRLCLRRHAFRRACARVAQPLPGSGGFAPPRRRPSASSLSSSADGRGVALAQVGRE